MNRMLPLLLLVLAPAAWSGEIYKWVDEQGHTHFGEDVPAKYRKSSNKIDAQPLNIIQGGGLKVAPPAAPADDKTANAADENAKEKAPDPMASEACQAQMRRYRESQECFARYRNANGSLKAEASANCHQVMQPTACGNL